MGRCEKGPFWSGENGWCDVGRREEASRSEGGLR